MKRSLESLDHSGVLGPLLSGTLLMRASSQADLQDSLLFRAFLILSKYRATFRTLNNYTNINFKSISSNCTVETRE